MISRRMGRYVVRSDEQIPFIDYTEVRAPVVRRSALRSLLTWSAAERLHILQLDIETAFLHGRVDEKFYVRQPKGFERCDPTRASQLVKAR